MDDPTIDSSMDTSKLEDDEDANAIKRSIGEELWQIHLRRSQGLEPDVDQDIITLIDDEAEEEEEEEVGNAEETQGMHELRNQNVSIPSH